MITKNNYSIRTEGTFKIIPRSWALRLKQAVQRQNICIGRSRIKLGNRTWIFDFRSWSKWPANFGSAYWISADGQWLIRLADHWSEAQAPVTQCGWIRSCYWKLAGIRPPVKHQKRKGWKTNSLQAGIIRLSELKVL